MGAKVGEKSRRLLSERPCVVLSSDYYNENRDRITVAPLTQFDSTLEQRLFLWGPAIDYGKEVEFDPSNATYIPETERLWNTDWSAKTGRQPLGILEGTQLWTIFATDGGKELPNDVRWDRRHGRLKDMNKVAAALQAVLSGAIRGDRGTLEYDEGDVFAVDVPGRRSQRCLVVSSTIVNSLRETTTVAKLSRPLGLITVVPILTLEEADGCDPKIDHTSAYIEISFDRGKNSELAIALCQELYTIDWRSRNATPPVGHVYDMRDVQLALRKYLDLPPP